MADLIFFTDRYPYSRSEAFIENEIKIMSEHFDRVFCLPCGLMVNIDSCRNVPPNVIILPPACSDDIYQHKPSRTEKNRWGIKNLFPWFFACLFSKYFYREVCYLFSGIGFSLARLVRIFRTLAPSIRNKYHFKKILSGEEIEEVYYYSYWLESTILFAEDILDNVICKKKISRTHRWDLYSEESPIGYLPFQKQIIANIDHLFIISDDGLKYLSDKYPSLANRMSISRLGTKDEGLNAQTSSSIFRIVSCSNLIPVKRVELIIEALSRLPSVDQAIEWIHFGSGQYVEQIKELAQNKLSNITYILKGQVTNTMILEYYRTEHVDIFINVSSSEGIPVSIMEAASFGIPIVATNVGGTGEIVIDGVNGYLLPRDFDIDTLKDVIGSLVLVNDQECYEKLRKQSRHIWQQFYFCEGNYREFYKEVLE